MGIIRAKSVIKACKWNNCFLEKCNIDYVNVENMRNKNWKKIFYY